jgi:glycosyltransferase
MPPHPTVFLRRDFLKLDPFNQNFKISADYDFILNLLLNKKIKVAYLPQVLIKMRVGGISNRSIQMIIQKSREDLKIINFHNLKGARTLAMKNLRKIPQFFFKKDI